MPDGILFTIIRLLTWTLRIGSVLEAYRIYRQIKHPKLVRPFWRITVFSAIWLSTVVIAYLIDKSLPEEWQGIISMISNLFAFGAIFQYTHRKRVEIQAFNKSPEQKDKLADRIGALADLIDDIPAVKRYRILNFPVL